MSSDLAIRTQAFDWLSQQVDLHGEILPWSLLADGFRFDGERVPLLSQQGIFKPRLCELPISIRSTPRGPYDDGISPDGFLRYRYQGRDPDHWQNQGLRDAMRKNIPLIYFHGLAPAEYLPTWPVYIVADDPTSLTFTVNLEVSYDQVPQFEPQEIAETRRSYATSTFRRRLHQTAFRQRVLNAYREQCAICRLRHRELLDAAHIVPDHQPEGEPRVSNGLALCKLHHAAFDNYFMTVSPDYRVLIRRDLLEESDGPMLRHGLQELHQSPIQVPQRRNLRPSRQALEERLSRFRKAS